MRHVSQEYGSEAKWERDLPSCLVQVPVFVVLVRVLLWCHHRTLTRALSFMALTRRLRGVSRAWGTFIPFSHDPNSRPLRSTPRWGVRPLPSSPRFKNFFPLITCSPSSPHFLPRVCLLVRIQRCTSCFQSSFLVVGAIPRTPFGHGKQRGLSIIITLEIYSTRLRLA
jgi:hypothetical protein